MYFGPRTPPRYDPDASFHPARCSTTCTDAEAPVVPSDVPAARRAARRLARRVRRHRRVLVHAGRDGALPGQAAGWLPPTAADALSRNVFLDLRLPRVLLAGLTGAVLGVSGTLMQGLFRNPIVEPGLAGTSAGAAFGAALVFVLGEQHHASVHRAAGFALAVPVLAFARRVRRDDAGVSGVDVVRQGERVHAAARRHRGERGVRGRHRFSVVRRPRPAGAEHHVLEPRHVHDGELARHDSGRLCLRGLLCLVAAPRQSRSTRSCSARTRLRRLASTRRRLILRLIVLNTIMVAVDDGDGRRDRVHRTGRAAHSAHAPIVATTRFCCRRRRCWARCSWKLIDIVARLVIPPAELPIGIITAVIGAPVFLCILLRQQPQRGTGASVESGAGAGFYG